jgi:hypothetical protein
MNINWNNWDDEEYDDEQLSSIQTDGFSIYDDEQYIITTDIENNILIKYIEFIKLFCNIN